MPRTIGASRGFARRRGSKGHFCCTNAQIAIAWVAAQGPDIVPLVGACKRERLSEALGSVDIELNDEDLASIARAVPNGAAAGYRYTTALLSELDSEMRPG
ncbi:aldo/keto reductase [Paraburkholderia sp. BR10937]|uniref:aldo/keto reductase n=1 Tax=Paraburkholderia sp. BR10937 TaxID=3236994 RepID=UPI0034D2A89B